MTNSPSPILIVKFSRTTILAHLVAVIVLAGTVCQVAVGQVAVSISPSLATLATLATQQFTATVTGGSNTVIIWEVNGVAGGNPQLKPFRGLGNGVGLSPNPAEMDRQVNRLDNGGVNPVDKLSDKAACAHAPAFQKPEFRKEDSGPALARAQLFAGLIAVASSDGFGTLPHKSWA